MIKYISVILLYKKPNNSNQEIWYGKDRQTGEEYEIDQKVVENNGLNTNAIGLMASAQVISNKITQLTGIIWLAQITRIIWLRKWLT